MKILYLDCGMGAAGDMLTAALYELLSEEKKKEFLEMINSLGIPGINVCAGKSKKCGITGTYMKVTVDGYEEEDYGHEHSHEAGYHHHSGHSHSSVSDIEKLLKSLNLSEKVREDAIKVYGIIAEAESIVHDTDISQIHFHEVGTKDAVIDILSVCYLINEIGPDRIITSPVCTGSGTVSCAHGILPVPAPATALILKDVPVYQGDISSELCTPTGAALLKHFTGRFAMMPQMSVAGIGYGMGKKDFERANCVRAFLGEAFAAENEAGPDEQVSVLSCNVDDMTGEEIGFAVERFLEEGAHEAFTVPVNMKKSRPGTMIELICAKSDTYRMMQLMFRYTTTIGIRQFDYKRYILDRSVIDKETGEGMVRIKESEGYGTKRSKPEYEDLARIARKKDMSLREAKMLVEKDITSED
ncbi:MAG: nickel pincer cofactor biosynthesis protein LarC [Lachnospiraceae bacterium]|nr:nickel pincer cofactor biosynthesis protein LarC [Lachnospiraceae bacterium]